MWTNINNALTVYFRNEPQNGMADGDFFLTHMYTALACLGGSMG